METQYILIRKNKSEAKKVIIQNDVKTILKDASFMLKNNVIFFSENDTENYVTYGMSYEDNNVLYLSINTSLSGEAAAKLLDKFDIQFVKGSHRKKFYIINAYSDSSQFYCKKLMPTIGTFERLLREFIYLTLTRVYGSDWIKILGLDRKEHIAEKSKGKVSKENEYIEVSLEWLDFSEIEDILFTPCAYEDVDVIVSEILSNKDITKDEVLDKLKTIEKKSLWEREFQKISDIKDLQENFNNIRGIRNTVMHNKAISFVYYEDSASKIKKTNQQLGNAIKKIKKEINDNTKTTAKSKTLVTFDISAISEAVVKAFYREEEARRKAELGKRLVEKYISIYGAVKVSDLINNHFIVNDYIGKKSNKT